MGRHQQLLAREIGIAQNKLFRLLAVIDRLKPTTSKRHRVLPGLCPAV